MVVVLVNVLVQLVGHALLHRRCSPSVQSNMTLVELGDAHSSDFSLSDRQARSLVDRFAHCVETGTHVGCQLPDARGLLAVAVGDVDTCHQWPFLVVT